MLIIEKNTIASMSAAANFSPLLDEYAVESSIDGMPPPLFRMEVYGHLEAAGLLCAFTAALSGQLVGFITVLASRLPRYEAPVAVSESFFVAKAHRMTGAGLRLLRAAEARAREIGAPGLLVSAPYGGKLHEVLPRLGYAETNRVFFKRLADA